MDKPDLFNLTPEEAADIWAKMLPGISDVQLLYALFSSNKGDWFTPRAEADRLENLYLDESYYTAGFDMDRRRQGGVVQFKVNLRAADSAPNS